MGKLPQSTAGCAGPPSLPHLYLHMPACCPFWVWWAVSSLLFPIFLPLSHAYTGDIILTHDCAWHVELTCVWMRLPVSSVSTIGKPDLTKSLVNLFVCMSAPCISLDPGDPWGAVQRGDVVAAERRSNSFGHTAAVVTLVDPQTKQWCQAFFKPSMKGDGDGWHRVKIEAAAYRLNLLLGMDYVPPAVFRTAQRDADWCSKVCGHDVEDGGVFVYWCPDSKDLKSIEPGDWGVRQDVLLSDTRILVSAHDDALGSRPLMQLAGAYASAHTGMRMGGPCLTRQHDGAGALLSFGFECSHWDHVGPHWNWVHRVGWWCVAGGTA
eukprot:365942-Chlamydomonas_euryale.AAC.60